MSKAKSFADHLKDATVELDEIEAKAKELGVWRDGAPPLRSLAWQIANERYENPFDGFPTRFIDALTANNTALKELRRWRKMRKMAKDDMAKGVERINEIFERTAQPVSLAVAKLEDGEVRLTVTCDATVERYSMKPHVAASMIEQLARALADDA